MLALRLNLDLIDARLHDRGGVTVVHGPPPRTMSDAETDVMWTLAPHAVADALAAREHVADGRPRSWYLAGGPVSAYQAAAPGNEHLDPAKALEDARSITATEREARVLVERGRRRAVALAQDPFVLVAVQRVAAELFTERHLGAPRIRELVHESEMEHRADRLRELGAPRRLGPNSRRAAGGVYPGCGSGSLARSST